MKIQMLALFAMLLSSSVYALDYGQMSVLPAGGQFAIINPGITYEKTFSLDTTGITWSSCKDLTNYQTGSCDYLYKCYIILPQSCTVPACAKDYFCGEITQLVNPESISVNYQTSLSDVGKKYAVAAFVVKAHLSYSWENQTWTDMTTVVSSSQQADNLQIPLPNPPAPNPNPVIGVFDQILF